MRNSIPRDAIDKALTAHDNGDAVDARAKMRRALRASGAIFPDTELMGAAEAAEELGVRSPNLRKVQGLPEPFGRVRSGPFWIADDIRALKARRQREQDVSGSDGAK